MEHLTINIDTKSADLRHETLLGREYVVAPMVMITHGVHKGSNGPLYYPEPELAKTPVVWNNKPIVVYHPEINGQGCSACDPLILNSRSIGVVMNTRYEDGKLKAEAWLETGRMGVVDKRVEEAIQNNQMMEVSTGLFCDFDAAEGEFGGKTYTHIARNYRPDHLAILPDKTGACSIKDGAGLLRNQKHPLTNDDDDDDDGVELSYESRREQLRTLLRKGETSDGPGTYVEDLYDEFVIFSRGPKLFKQEYSSEGGRVSLVGLPTEVVKVIEYRTLDGTYVGNAAPVQVQGEKPMTKTELIGQLVANAHSGWKEEDRKALEAVDETLLQRMVANAPGDEEEDDEDEVEDVEDVDDAEEVEDEELATQNMTPEQYIALAPPGIRDMLISGLAVHNVQKQELINSITANTACGFTKEQLAAKSLGELQLLAKLAAPAPTANVAPATYFGASAPAPVTNVVTETPLPLPKMDWSKK